MPTIIDENQNKQRLEQQRASGAPVNNPRNYPDGKMGRSLGNNENSQKHGNAVSREQMNSERIKSAMGQKDGSSQMTTSPNSNKPIFQKSDTSSKPNQKKSEKQKLANLNLSRAGGKKYGKLQKQLSKGKPIDKKQLKPKGTIKRALTFYSLLGQIDISRDFFFAIALVAAIIKDTSDITVGLIPGIGWILSFLFTIMASIVIFFCMLITKTPFKLRSGIKNFLGKKWVVLIGASLMEMIYGLDFLPIETLCVIIIIFLTLWERQTLKMEEEQEKIKLAIINNSV